LILKNQVARFEIAGVGGENRLEVRGKYPFVMTAREPNEDMVGAITNVS